MVECTRDDNKKKCTCSYPCERKGVCCTCLRYHRNRGELPACFFSSAAEKMYDRSIEHFIQTSR
jgi:hypothetical protein